MAAYKEALKSVLWGMSVLGVVVAIAVAAFMMAIHVYAIKDVSQTVGEASIRLKNVELLYRKMEDAASDRDPNSWNDFFSAENALQEELLKFCGGRPQCFFLSNDEKYKKFNESGSYVEDHVARRFWALDVKHFFSNQARESWVRSENNMRYFSAAASGMLAVLGIYLLIALMKFKTIEFNNYVVIFWLASPVIIVLFLIGMTWIPSNYLYAKTAVPDVTFNVMITYVCLFPFLGIPPVYSYLKRRQASLVSVIKFWR